MRILVAHKAWRPIGGVEDHMFQVVRLLERRGHEVIPFSTAHEANLPTPYDRYFPDDVDFRGGSVAGRAHAAGRALVGWAATRRLEALLDAEPIDAAYVLHVYHQLGTTVLPLLRRRGVPILLSLHDYKLGCPSYRLFDERTGRICTQCLDRAHAYLWAPAARRCWGGSALGGLALSAEAATTRLTRAYRCADIVLVVNELLRHGVIRAGVDPSRIRMLPHPVALPGTPPPREPGQWALYVGRLVPEKGVDVLVRAAAGSGVPVRVVGDGRSAGDLRALRDRLGAPVTFVGALGRAGVEGEMRRAAMLVVPSVWHEIWGLVINEAIANRLPVVASAVGAIPGILGQGRGVLVPPGDAEALGGAMARLLVDPRQGEQAAERAWDFAAAELTPAQWVSRLEAAFAEVGVTL